MTAFNKIEWGDFYNPKSGDLIRQRILIDKLAKESSAFRLKILERCRNDSVFWINNFVWTSDPRNLDINKPSLTPFQCFPKQEHYLKWRRECRKGRVSGFLLKSRDSGASWMNVADQVHSWLFEAGFSGGMASRKEKFVDEIGNMDSLFEKARFIIRYLPGWMKPDQSDIIDNFCKLINLTNDASIIGESGDEIGRGGRKSIQDVDEVAYVPRAEKVARSLSQTTNTVIWTSTPDGKSNFYGKSYLSGRHETFFIHWKDDPRKNDEWYDRMVNTLDKLTIAREIDASFEESAENVMFKYSRLVDCTSAFRKKFKSPLITAGLDVATAGSNKSIYTLLEAGCQVRKQEEIDLSDTSQIGYAAHKRATLDRVNILVVDVVAVGEGVVSTLSGIPNRNYKIIPFRGNMSPTKFYWENHDCTSAQRFINIRAEMAHIIQLKVSRTYEHKKGIRQHDYTDMISFNQEDTTKLFTEMEMVEAVKKPDGKIKLPSKVELRDMGIKSPDYFDSLCLAMAGTLLDKTCLMY